MRLPRVRITLGMLLFAVAIAALNFAAFRELYQAEQNEFAFRLPASLPFWVIGLIPLAEVALIGLLLLAARWVRSLCGRNIGSARRPAGAFTYFSLHFLAVAVVAVLFAPDAVERLVRLATRPIDHLDYGILWPYSDRMSQFAQRGVWLCALLSGPPLLLSAISGILARRSAAKLPRYRFRALTLMVSVGFACVAFAIAETPRPFEDEEEVALDFRIVDKESGEPIHAAFIAVKYAFGHHEVEFSSRGLTGPDGRARLTDHFSASGESNLFRVMGSFEPWGRWLEVSAPHYQPLRIPLTDLLTCLADLEHPGLPTIALARGETPEKPFADIAGDYRAFHIEPDGRFAWHRSGGCCGPSYWEYGRLTRVEGELVLAPFPHVGHEAHPAMKFRYRPITWGNQLYLCSIEDGDLHGFLREKLRQEWREPSLRRIYCGYPRLNPCDKPQPGLSQLPARVWIGFALGELDLRDEDSTLRRALDPFVVQPFRKEKGAVDDRLRSLDVSLAR